MKKINEMTESEILNLTDDDIERLIKIEMAEEGIKFVKKPEKPKYHKLPEEDRVCFYCDLFGNSLVFTDVNELKAILDIIEVSTTKFALTTEYKKPSRLRSKIGSVYGDTDYSKITSEKAYSPSLYAKSKKLIEENAKLKGIFDKENNEYNKNIDLSSEIREYITGIFDEVIKAQYDRERYLNIFKNEYLSLADNNYQVALKFIDKAYKLTDNQKQFIKDSYPNEFTIIEENGGTIEETNNN